MDFYSIDYCVHIPMNMVECAQSSICLVYVDEDNVEVNEIEYYTN